MRLEMLQDLKYEGQEIMVAGDKENEAVTNGVSCWMNFQQYLMGLLEN